MRRLGAVALAGLLGGCALLPAPGEPPLPYQPPVIDIRMPPPLAPVAADAFVHGPRDAPLIALTFDACSTTRPSRYDERVARVLLELNVPATIFLGGRWMEEHPEHTRFLAAFEQFELGNHSFLQPHMTRETDARIRQEIEWTQQVMHTLTGRQARLFRAPYGEHDARVRALAAELGLTTVHHDLASGDPDRRISKSKLVEYVTRTARNGSIGVMHINQRGYHTAEALPEIVTRLRARGFRLVTVGELLARSRPTPPEPEETREPAQQAHTARDR